MLQLALLVGLLFGLLNLPVYSPDTIKIINNYEYIFTILGALGVTIMGNQLGFIRRKSHQSTMRLLGYTKELLKMNKEHEID
jgi:xanthosine utilization system XapX-like protein